MLPKLSNKISYLSIISYNGKQKFLNISTEYIFKKPSLNIYRQECFKTINITNNILQNKKLKCLKFVNDVQLENLDTKKYILKIFCDGYSWRKENKFQTSSCEKNDFNNCNIVKVESSNQKQLSCFIYNINLSDQCNEYIISSNLVIRVSKLNSNSSESSSFFLESSQNQKEDNSPRPKYTNDSSNYQMPRISKKHSTSKKVKKHKKKSKHRSCVKKKTKSKKSTKLKIKSELKYTFDETRALKKENRSLLQIIDGIKNCVENSAEQVLESTRKETRYNSQDTNVNKMNQNLFQLQRTFSDSALQNNWCLNTNLYWTPQTAYAPVCSIPVRNLVELTGTKKKWSKVPERTLSSGDVSNDSQNYILNVQNERKRLENFRQWEDTTLGASLKNVTNPSGFIFTIMSYNVLAQILLTEHMYLYRKHHPHALYWEHRKWALMREFQEHNADILCLQEVEKTHLDSFYSQLHNLGYKGIFKSRTGIRIDGCALYYKDSKFDLIEYTTVEYFQPDIEVLNRENVAIVARLAEKGNPSNQFVVATTHLLYNPKRNDIRLAQTQLLLAEVDRIAFDKINEKNEQEFVPVIISGDFNLEPYSPVYKLIINGELNYSRLSKRKLKDPKDFIRNDQPMGNEIIPRHLGVTDNCQHAELFYRRTRGAPKLNRDEELNLIKLDHSERSKLNSEKSPGNLTNSKELFSSGKLSHGFNLFSVYRHIIPGKGPEATTNQGDWITVDYIFYSGKRNRPAKEQGRLKLLSRCRLPTAVECQQLPCIPNLVYGSDHLALLAKFILV